jgi:hypothetical protein
MKSARFAALAAAVSMLAVPVSANHSWNGYHWATNGTLDVKVNAALTSAWTSYLDIAIADWEKSADLVLGSRNNVSVSRKKCTPIEGEILVCNDLYGQRGWLGIASIWLSPDGHITKGTTKLNDTYYSQARYNTPAWRMMVMCQEVGHDFGLAHQDEGFTNPNLGSCMDYTNDPTGKAGTNGTLSNEHPDQHDYDQLALIYNHDDGYTTAKRASSTNFGVREFGQGNPPQPAVDASGDGPAEWGYAVHNDGLGRPDVFVQDLPGGGRKITHVFWALETKRSEIHHD